MKNLNLKEVSKLISKKQGKKIEITKFELIGSGYHSNGYLLHTKTGKQFFIKKIKSNDLGFELPERKVSSLLLSNAMSQRAKAHPSGIGVIIKNKNKEFIPRIDDETEIFHVQNFIPNYKKDTINYYECIRKKRSKKKLDSTDREEMNLIVKAISKIHQQRHKNKKTKQLKKIYNDGLRNLLTNPELALMLIQSYGHDSEILPRKDHTEYIGLMLDNIYRWEDRYDRLSALHGDFWGSNLFVIDGKVQLIDFSRIPWGDAGIDIGWWINQYLWLYYETKNEYYKQSLEKFLKLYVKENNDKEIYQALAPVMGLMGIINTNPLFQPDIDIKIAKKYIDNIWRILKKQEFTW